MKMAFTAKLACAALIVPGFLMAGIVPAIGAGSGTCTAADLCTYDLTMSGVNPSTRTENTGATWTVDFTTLGPEMFNAPNNFEQSFTVNGMPSSGWVEDTGASGLTSYGADGAVMVQFDDTNVDSLGLASVTFIAFGTDTFWATTGGPFTFGGTDNPSATSGAFFYFTTVDIPGVIEPIACAACKPFVIPEIAPQETSDVPCAECNVVISATAAPEPGSATLLVPALGLGALLFRRKQTRLAA